MRSLPCAACSILPSHRFSADGSFDPQAFADTAERMIAFGYDGLLIGGTLASLR